MITNWYSKKELMQPIVDTIYESYSKAPKFLKTSFLSSIQGLEIYHRRFKQNINDLIVKHFVIWKKIVGSLTDDQVAYINKFEYAYEHGLTQRLKDLIHDFDISKIKNILGDKKQIKEFVYKTEIKHIHELSY
jgi:hypothetical protein